MNNLRLLPLTTIIGVTIDPLLTPIKTPNRMTLIIKSAPMAELGTEGTLRTIFVGLAGIGIVIGVVFGTGGSVGAAVPASLGMTLLVGGAPVACDGCGCAGCAVGVVRACVRVVAPWPCDRGWITGTGFGTEAVDGGGGGLAAEVAG